jgi:hypothetical protein
MELFARGSKHLCYVGQYLPDYTAQYPRQPSSYPSPWEPEISSVSFLCAELDLRAEHGLHLTRVAPGNVGQWPNSASHVSKQYVTSKSYEPVCWEQQCTKRQTSQGPSGTRLSTQQPFETEARMNNLTAKENKTRLHDNDQLVNAV